MQLHHKVDGVVVSMQLVILKRISIETGVRILLNLDSLMQCYVGFICTCLRILTPSLSFIRQDHPSGRAEVCKLTCLSTLKERMVAIRLRRGGGFGGQKNKFGLYQSPTCHGVTTFYRIAKSSFMTKIWRVKVRGYYSVPYKI